MTSQHELVVCFRLRNLSSQLQSPDVSTYQPNQHIICLAQQLTDSHLQ